MKKGFVSFLVVALVGYGGIVAWFAANESSYIYFPNKTLSLPAEGLSFAYERVEIPSSDGVLLSAVVVRAERDSEAAPWILFFHGNGGNIGSRGYLARYGHLHDFGVNVLAIDYRGYGASTGEPSETGLYEDARRSYDYLVTQEKVSPSKIILFGYSLGAAVAINLATEVECAGLIVEGAFTSIADRGQELYPFLPIGWLARTRYDSIEKIGRIKIPKLHIHATQDEIIPIHHGRTLFDKAPQPKIFLEVKGGHNNSHAVDKDVFYSAIEQFIKTIEGDL